MSGGPDEYPDITNKEPKEKEIRTEPPEDDTNHHLKGIPNGYAPSKSMIDYFRK